MNRKIKLPGGDKNKPVGYPKTQPRQGFAPKRTPAVPK